MDGTRFLEARETTAAEALDGAFGRLGPEIVRRIRQVQSDADPAGPHGLRIGLRRLRAALATFGDGPARDALSASARELARAVAPLREADVLIDAILEPAVGEEAPALGLAAALWREETRERTRRAVAAPRWDALLGACASGWAPAGAARPDVSGRRAAQRAVRRRWRRARQWGARIEDLTLAERHEMRKTLKKLRYTLELQTDGADPARRARVLKRLKGLQEIFGYLNDVAGAQALSRIAARGAAPTLDRDVVRVYRWHAERAAAAWPEARAQWRRLDRLAREAA